jgi:ribosomal protein S18 acetylase RimI-like enzyme
VIEIREVEGFEQLVGLERLVEGIFGAGNRAPGWFRRKLGREGIEGRLSGIAIDRGEPSACVLVGPGSEAVARASMIGVASALRGRGVGRALIDFACARARLCGFSQLEFSSEGERIDWYLQQGFELVEQQLTMCASGLGSRDEISIGVGVEVAPIGPAAVWSWLPEIWTRTPAHERAYLELGGAKIWLSREGRAWLAQRLELEATRSGTELVRVVGQLRHAIARDTPVLLYPCTAETPTAEALLRAGFVALQQSFLVRRPTR